MARRKQAALEGVPQSDTQAAEMVQDYVRAERVLLELQLGYQVQLDKLKADRDCALLAMTTEQQGRFARLKAWWEAGGRDLAGKRRSAELAGATLGIRLTPPAVKFARGWTAQKVLDELLGWLGGDFIRTKYELDKPAIAAVLASTPAKRKTKEARHNHRVLTEKLELTLVQTDEFFIDCGIDEAAIRARFNCAATPSNQE